MSLINKVLHDLEERHAFPAMQPQGALSDLRSAQDYAQGTRATGNRAAVLLGALVLITIAAIVAVRNWPTVPVVAPLPDRATGAAVVTRPATRAETDAAKREIAVTAPATQVVAADSGVQLKLDMPDLDLIAASGVEQAAAARSGNAPALMHIGLAGNDSDTRIDLFFSQPPRYSLHVLDRPNRLLVLVPDAELPMEPLREFIPASLVLGLRHGREAGNEKLIFDLAAPVVIAGAHMRPRSGGGHALEIRLSSSVPAPGTDDVESTGEPMQPPLESVDSDSTVQPALQVVRRPPEAEGPADREFRLGAEAYRLGDMTRASEGFRRAITEEPSHIKARQFLVAVLIDQGDLAGAERFVAEGLEYHPQDPVLLRSSARILFENGRADAALEVLSRARPALEDDPDHYALMAAILQRQGRHAEAAQLYSQLVRLEPEHGVWWAGLGISLESLGRGADALSAFERARRDGSAPADVRRYATDRIIALSRRSG